MEFRYLRFARREPATSVLTSTVHTSGPVSAKNSVECPREALGGHRIHPIHGPAQRRIESTNDRLETVSRTNSSRPEGMEASCRVQPLVSRFVVGGMTMSWNVCSESVARCSNGLVPARSCAPPPALRPQTKPAARRAVPLNPAVVSRLEFGDLTVSNKGRWCDCLEFCLACLSSEGPCERQGLFLKLDNLCSPSPATIAFAVSLPHAPRSLPLRMCDGKPCQRHLTPWCGRPREAVSKRGQPNGAAPMWAGY